jgi:hypothetical protein
MNITALLDKLAPITEGQEKELLTAALEGKDMAPALEAFCQKHGIEMTGDERNAGADYFKTGKLPLSDQELDNVAGGWGYGSNELKCPGCGEHDATGYRLGNSWVAICRKCKHRWVVPFPL